MEKVVKKCQSFFVIALILACNSVFSQELILKDTAIHSDGKNEIKLPLKISYYGVMVTHPGLKIGTEFSIKKTQKTKVIKDKIKTKTNNLFVSPNFGFYYHKRYHIGLFINTEITYQRIQYRGFLWDITLGAGYMRTILPNTTYKVSAQGEVSKIFLAGSNYFMPSFSLGIGRRFITKSNKNIMFFIKPGIFLYTPFNTNKYPAPNISFDIGLKFENFIKNRLK